MDFDNKVAITRTDFDDKAALWDADPMKTARANAVAQGIRDGLALAPTLRGFEFGCGTGLLSFALRDALGELTLADTSPGMLAVLREKIARAGIANMHPVQLDLLSDPPPTTRYDLAYSLMTLHHIPDTAAILRALHDLLAPGGHLCIADLEHEDGSFHEHDPSVHNGFERGALQNLLENTGFTDVRFTTVFTIEKERGGERRDYPVFLMIARKSDQAPTQTMPTR